MDLIFEDLVLDIIGELPEEDGQRLQELNLHDIFSTKAVEWRGVVREVLHLSDTFDTAVADLWYRNRQHAREEGFEYEPRAFAAEFVKRYLADGSKVDVWTPESLAAAQQRIATFQRGG